MLAKFVIFNTDSPSDLVLVVRKSVVNPEILEFSSSPSTTLIYLTLFHQHVGNSALISKDFQPRVQTRSVGSVQFSPQVQSIQIWDIL